MVKIKSGENLVVYFCKQVLDIIEIAKITDGRCVVVKDLRQAGRACDKRLRYELHLFLKLSQNTFMYIL